MTGQESTRTQRGVRFASPRSCGFARCGAGRRLQATRPPSIRRCSAVGVVVAIALCVAHGCAVPPAPPDDCANVECEAGQTCVGGTCILDATVQECIASSDCAANWLCVDSMCEPDSTGDVCEVIVCAPGEVCLAGVCVSDPELTSCTADTDCAEGETCEVGMCMPAVTPDSSLAQENPGVDFGNLIVGEIYNLVAPNPIESPDDSILSPNSQDSPPDGETPGNPAPADCSCAWTVTPDPAAAFTDAFQCAADLTPLLAGDLTIAVTVTCETAAEVFSETAIALMPPTPCTVHDDCPQDELCLESLCIRRIGPLMTVLGERPRSPYVVTLDLRLEDTTGIPIHTGVSRDDFSIFENDVEIAYDESGYSVAAAPNLPLKVFLVLDYTVSMERAAAIGPMIAAADQFIRAEHLADTHHIGVIEFHDRRDKGEGFAVVAPLTPMDELGKLAVAAAVPSEGSVEPGLSRAWDAVDLAITKLGETERQPGERHAIVFMTDSHDTTSVATLDSIVAAAKSNDITFYTVDFGTASEPDADLSEIANQTRGLYFSAADTDDLVRVFADIALDLRGQWTLNYITQKNTGSIDIRIEFGWGGAVDTFETNVNVAGLEGDIHQAVVEVLDGHYDATSDTTSFVLDAVYVPRNVDRFRFFVAHDAGDLALFDGSGAIAGDGGWTVVASGGMFDLVGIAPLSYGSFGSLAVVTVPGDTQTLQVTHDDSVYESLGQTKTAVFEGEAHLPPARLAVDVLPAAGGIVLPSPDRFAYANGSTVSLTAGAVGDHVFKSWEGSATGTDFTTSVVMDGDKSVTANFHPPRSLTVVVEPEALGSVTKRPNRESYRHGELVALTATPGVGGLFSAWSGAVTGTGTAITVTMDGDKTVTATFVASP